MAISSLQKFLRPEKPRATDYLRFLHLLLHGIGLHCVAGDPEDQAQFRISVAVASQAINEESTTEQILLRISDVNHALADYERSTTAFVHAREHELEAIVALTTDAIGFLSDSGNTGVERLQAVEKTIEKALTLEDIRRVRARVEQSLVVVKNESIRVRTSSEEPAGLPRNGFEPAGDRRAPAPQPALLDPATGFPGRHAAEARVAALIADGGDTLAALFVVDRLASLNARFGRAVGDQILVRVAQHLGEKITGNGSLFRWSGPAFLAFFPVVDSLLLAKTHAKNIAGARLEENVETAGRSVLVPISLSTHTQRVNEDDSAEEIFRTLDSFLASHGGAA